MTTNTKTIVVVGGDHVGPEVTKEAVKVLRAVEKALPRARFEIEEHLIGGAAIDATNDPLPEATLSAARHAHAVLLGAVGGPKWGTGDIRPEQGLLRIRKELNFYANLRPCNFASESLVEMSPLKSNRVRGTDILVVRELVGGIYFGDRVEDTGAGVAWDTEKYSVPEVERIARIAGYLARETSPPRPVWSLDKANVLASSRLWRKTVERVFTTEFPELELHHQLIDSAAMILVQSPTKLNGVVLTSNMFGDIFSDEASVIPGSLGLMPSASLAGVPDTNSAFGLYEPCHGSAPDLDPGKVNPLACILSAAMMLRLSLELPEAADAVEKAVTAVIDQGVRTGDLGGTASTEEVGDAVAKEVERLLG